MAIKKHWYDGLVEQMQSPVSGYKPSFTYTGKGQDNIVQPQKPIGMADINGQPSIVHEGEMVGSNGTVIPANDTNVLLAKTPQDQNRIAAIKKRYGLSGYAMGNPLSNVGSSITSTINSIKDKSTQPQTQTTTPTGPVTGPQGMGFSINTKTGVTTNAPSTVNSTGVNSSGAARTNQQNSSINTNDLITVNNPNVNESLNILKNQATYNDPYYRNLTNTQTTALKAAGASANLGMASTLAATPNMPSGAQNVAMASANRDVNANESILRGSLASTAAQTANTAASQYATLSQNLVKIQSDEKQGLMKLGIDEKQADAIIKQQHSAEIWAEYNGLIGAGGPENIAQAAKLVKDNFGIDLNTNNLNISDVGKTADYFILTANSLIDTDPVFAGNLYAKAMEMIAEQNNVSVYDPSWETDFANYGNIDIEDPTTAQTIRKDLDLSADHPISVEDYKNYKLREPFLHPTEINTDGTPVLTNGQVDVLNKIFLSPKIKTYFTSGDGQDALVLLASDPTTNAGKLITEMSQWVSDPTKDVSEQDIADYTKLTSIMYADYDQYSPVRTTLLSQNNIDWAASMGYTVQNIPDNIKAGSPPPPPPPPPPPTDLSQITTATIKPVDVTSGSIDENAAAFRFNKSPVETIKNYISSNKPIPSNLLGNPDIANIINLLPKTTSINTGSSSGDKNSINFSHGKGGGQDYSYPDFLGPKGALGNLYVNIGGTLYYMGTRHNSNRAAHYDTSKYTLTNMTTGKTLTLTAADGTGWSIA